MCDTNRKLRVTLVRGPIVFRGMEMNKITAPAIGYAYIAGYLRNKGYEPVMVDAICEGLNQTWPLKKYAGHSCCGLTFNKIVARIPENSDVIGFSNMMSYEWPVTKELISHVRKYFPGALFVAGGEHITALTEYSLRDCPSLDVCVRGEGEHTFYQLLEAYSETGSFVDVNSISYLDKDGCYHQNGEIPPRIFNIDDIPWPYWPDGYLEKFWEEDKCFGIPKGRDMPFIISRGCPYQCTFCSNSQMWANRYILRDVNHVIEEIKYYIAHYGIKSVQLYDMTAIVQKNWIVEFCQRLIKEDIRLNWSIPSGTRSEGLDGQTLRLLKKTGYTHLGYAPESGSQRTLKIIKKRIRLSELTRSVIEAKRQKLTVRINFIIGIPGETWWDVFQTILYGLNMSVKGVDDVSVAIFSPYPGAEIFRELLSAGKIVLNDEYFFTLNPLDPLDTYYFLTDMVSYNPNTKVSMLQIVRIIFLLIFYTVGYILYPHRIIRTVRNLFFAGKIETELEKSLKNLFKRKFS